MQLSMLSPRMGGVAYPWEIDSTSFSLGGDFDIRVLPWGRKFDIATTCFGQKAVPRAGNLTFCRCPGVGNLTPPLEKMSNSPGSACFPPTLGLNIDRCITQQGSKLLASYSCSCHQFPGASIGDEFINTINHLVLYNCTFHQRCVVLYNR